MIAFKDFIAEAKQVGTVYHFTTLEALYTIVTQSEPFLMGSKNGETFSMTRNPSLFINPHFRECGVRITLDGDKLSEKYKVRPVAGFSYDQRGVLDVHSPEPRILRSKGEAEEALIQLPINIRKFIKHIHIFPSPNDERLYSEIDKRLNDMGISHKYGRAMTNHTKNEELDFSEHIRELKMEKYGR